MDAADRRPLGVTTFFVQMGEDFVQGRIEEMTRSWSFPCPIEVDGQLVVMREPEMLGAFLSERRAASLADGLTAMVPHVSAIEMPRKGRFRVWLRWLLHFGDDIREAGHGTVYFMARKPAGGLVIEMMDIVPLPSDSAAARSA